MQAPGLSTLETIIHTDIGKMMYSGEVPSAEKLFLFKEMMSKEAERIKNSIMASVVNVKKKKDRPRVIQLHQQELVGFTAKLLEYTHPEKIVSESGEAALSLLPHYAYESLDDLLHFVERHFGSYAAIDSWVPSGYYIIVAEAIRQEFEQLSVRLNNSGMDSLLRDNLITLFTDFLDRSQRESSNEMTYRRVRYLKVLSDELMKVTEPSDKLADIPKAVDQLLMNLNFNSPRYFTYCTNKMMDEVNAIEIPKQKLDRLSLFLKQINQLRDKAGMIYDSRFAPLKEQLAGWLIEELNYQEKVQQLELSFVATDPVIRPEVKIQYDLSVAQMACLVKGMIGCGVIQNKNVSEVIRVIASTSKTKRSSETISVESFRMRYYNIEDSTKEAVIKTLKQITEYLNKN